MLILSVKIALGAAEHMLFFSSEKYPEEDALFKFLVEVKSCVIRITQVRQ